MLCKTFSPPNFKCGSKKTKRKKRRKEVGRRRGEGGRGAGCWWAGGLPTEPRACPGRGAGSGCSVRVAERSRDCRWGWSSWSFVELRRLAEGFRREGGGGTFVTLSRSRARAPGVVWVAGVLSAKLRVSC